MQRSMYREIRRRIRAPLVTSLPGQDVDDALQETLLRAHKSRHLFRFNDCSEARLYAWFRSIARKVALDRRRRYERRRHRVAHLDCIDTNVIGESSIALCDGLEPASLEFESVRDGRDTVRRGIESLPASYRHVLTQHRLCGRPLTELAKEAGVSTVAMRVRAHRGYRALATVLAERAANEPESPVGDRHRTSIRCSEDAVATTQFTA